MISATKHKLAKLARIPQNIKSFHLAQSTNIPNFATPNSYSIQHMFTSKSLATAGEYIAPDCKAIEFQNQQVLCQSFGNDGYNSQDYEW